MQTGTLITWNPKNNDSFIGLRKLVPAAISRTR